MIYTVTFNPALDYILRVDDFTAGIVNRVRDARILCGGKGVNVSWVLHNLGVASTALGFLAGFTGREIERMLREHGCDTDFVYVQDELSRINVKLIAHEESELNAQGPKIEDIAPLLAKTDVLKEDDVLVLAGYLSGTTDAYEQILSRTHAGKCVVDTTGEALMRALKYKPFLIKPNNHELGEIFNRTLNTREEIVECARALQNDGAQNVLVSMAGDGALMVASDGRVFSCAAPKGTVKGSTGAGDSMVAGFIAGYAEKGDLEHAFYMGVATGSASAFSEELAVKEEVYALLAQIEK
ncbi:MAG: 1-phosphofructokinase [Christensenella sp.]